LVEAKREFEKVSKAFDVYLKQTKHLRQTAILLAVGDNFFVNTQDSELPWLPLLYAAANLMAQNDHTHDEVKGTFLRFVDQVLDRQALAEPPTLVHPFEQLRAVMIATIDELMPVLR